MHPGSNLLEAIKELNSLCTSASFPCLALTRAITVRAFQLINLSIAIPSALGNGQHTLMLLKLLGFRSFVEWDM